MTPARWIATVGGIGRLPRAPGTWGSLAALPLGYGLHYLGGAPLVGLGILASFALGLWSVGVLTAGEADPDRSEIVIDEVAGQLIALLPLSLGLWLAGAAPHVFPYPGWIGAFILFNLFIALPPVGRLAARHVILDDLAAGALAASVTLLSAGISHGWFA